MPLGPAYADRSEGFNNTKIQQFTAFLPFGTLAAIFEFFMVSQRPGRYLEPFLEPVASYSPAVFITTGAGTAPQGQITLVTYFLYY